MNLIRPKEELTFTLGAIYRSWKRKTRALQTVTHQPKLTDLDQKNFVDRIKKIHSLAIRTNSFVEKTESFWKMENLTSEYLKLVGEDLNLRDPAIPVETLPITHCGAGIAAVEVSGFELEKITLLIDSVAHPDYRLFCFEGIGAMLGVYEPGFFLLISKILKSLGMFQMKSHPSPGLESYVTNLEPEVQRLVSHGFGRLRYFRSSTLNGAIQGVINQPGLDTRASLQGITFALVMVNSLDLLTLLHHPPRIGDPTVDGALKEGMAYGLVFWDWMSPGFIEKLNPENEHAFQIISQAQEEIEVNQANGFPRAFGFSNL